MHIFFNPDIVETLKASTPEAIKRNKIFVRVIEIIIYFLVLSAAACGIYGDRCIADEIGAGRKERNRELPYCKKFILAEFILQVGYKIILASFQFYSLALIFIIARQNQQKLSTTLCT